MQQAKIGRRYHFEAGHWLPKVSEGHKCKRPHGHNYVLDISIEDQIQNNGFVIDFWDLDTIVNPIIQIVDHRMLNDLGGLENPTAENIARWFLNQIMPHFAHCNLDVRIYETDKCWATVTYKHP